MPDTSTDSATYGIIIVAPRPQPLLSKSCRRKFVYPSAAERLAARMIALHGANAAREAAIHLNRMIDRGDLPARDLWAYVVHLIHEHLDEGETLVTIRAA